MTSINVKKLDPSAKIPTRATSGSAGLDLYALSSCHLPPGKPMKIPTGIAVQLPLGHVGQIWDRSGLGSTGIHRLCGVIDADYEGDVTVCLINLTDEDQHISAGQKIAQMLVVPCVIVDVTETWSQIRSSERGTRGFGSSDKVTA